MRRTGAPDTVGALVAYKDRRNALRNPYAHLHEKDIALERVRSSPKLWDPIRYSETCPSSDGACAMVLTDEAGGRRAPGPVDWVHGRAMRSEPTTESGVTELDGDLPVSPSGGVLSTDPIGASGMIRFAEAALQVPGTAGGHQVDGARPAPGHAYGGGSQLFALWVVGSGHPGE